ncbi:MAG: amino acid permease, partial [Pirellulaceae bacterium]|nr:amino acid permease [Pirellulaceae bacterium]
MWSNLFRRKDVLAIRSELEVQSSDAQLHRNLNLFDLVCFGIAAIVGAGIFSTIGSASFDGGPAVTLLFILTAITCLFSALCYAEFAARVPVSGSAYTYAYAAFGELIAWIIGWDLLMEYAIGNSTVAFSWSEYLSTLLAGFDIHMPAWIENDYYSCAQAAAAQANGTVTADGLARHEMLMQIWNTAPQIGGMRFIVDIPALMINFLVTCLVFIGIKESKTASNMMVVLKVCVVLGVIAVGAFYVQPENWSPFAPNGATGVLKGIAAVFFAYIGFDAISTTAEECHNPQRDLPRATILTLIICTILYIAIAIVLTGMVSYRELGVGDPLAFVFQKYELNWMAGIVSLSAIIAITSVFLVFQIGQPRIWMAMARDGLLPARFASIHPRFKTPAFATVITGILVAMPIIFLNQAYVTDLCSIGTLFAFMLVSGGVLVINQTEATAEPTKTFRVPYF